MTSSAAELTELDRVRRRILLALFTALAIAVHTVEVLLPSPVPWFRLGLANVLTVVVLFLFGGRAAWSLTLVRIGLGALLLGRLFSPGFWLALAGGMVATACMTAAKQSAGARVGPVGISMLGAAGHAFGQVLTAWLLVVKHDAVWQIFPVFLLSAVAAGLLTGWFAALLLEFLATHPVIIPDAADDNRDQGG